ncbi:MAG: FecR domain-containing protein [Deltaproteobacteria bacterium]|nr:FecR domain-containing protein [Deltaproteobacteria bacterium]
MVRLALQAVGLQGERKELPGLLDRIIWAHASALVAAVVVVLILVAGLAWTLHAPAVPRAPVLAARLVKGRNLSLDGVAVESKAAPNTVVRAGSRLEVKKNGIAELSLERGGIVRVFPGSSLTLSGPGERIQLDRGKIWCLVERAGNTFAVQTDTARVRVVGTSFVVERQRSGETEVRVMRGEVEVEDSGKRGSIRIKGGWKTRVSPGNPPGPPRRYNPRRDRSDWERFLDELLRGIRRAVKKVKDLVKGL